MIAHLGFQRSLQHRFGQLFEQPVFPDDLVEAILWPERMPALERVAS